MKNLLVMYLCFSTYTGQQDVAFTYLVESEEEALRKFHEDGHNEEYEINDIFIDELTEEEAIEYEAGTKELDEEELKEIERLAKESAETMEALMKSNDFF